MPGPHGDAAIVLQHTDLGEADRVISLLTEHHGRVDAIARSVRVSKRRFGGMLDIGTRLVARWQSGRGALTTLLDVDEARPALVARTTYDRLALMVHGCEVVAKLAGEAPDPRHYKLLCAFLDVLEGQAEPCVATRLAFEAKALTFSGLSPKLVLCANCGERIEDPCGFDHAAGGAVHERCGQGVQVTAHALWGLEALRRTPLAQTPGFAAPEGVHWLLCDFIQYQMGVPLRARAMLSDSVEF